MFVGALITTILCTAFIAAGLCIRRFWKFKLHMAYKHNCVDAARLVKSQYDTAHSIHHCIYEYSSGGMRHSYTKFYFGEEPPEHLTLVWEAGNPSSPTEALEIHSDYSGVGKICLITAIVSFLFSLFLPQLTLILLSLWLMCFCVRGSAFGKVGMAVLVLPVLSSAVLWAHANIDPLAYYEVSYDLNTKYPEITAQLSIIEDLDELQRCELYEDVLYSNMDIKEGTESRKFPIFGQFVNKHWKTVEPFVWPEGYEKYASWDYRSDVFDEHYGY